jgi:hypothetical protein
MVRNIGAVIAGFLVVGLVVFVLQQVGSALYPLPPGLDPMNPDDQADFQAYVAAMPAASWAMAFASEIIGAFLGAFTAGKIASTKRRWFAGGIVGLAVVGSIMNWVAFSHPMWFIVGQLVAYPAVWFAVTRLLGDEAKAGTS